jgi:hypothetical protein
MCFDLYKVIVREVLHKCTYLQQVLTTFAVLYAFVYTSLMMTLYRSKRVEVKKAKNIYLLLFATC